MTSLPRQVVCRLLGGTGRATLALPTKKLPALLAPSRPLPLGTAAPAWAA